MEMNLKTTLIAYPKLSPSILENYVTKDELAERDYVSHPELNTILTDYVTEVQNPDPYIIYGRREVNSIMTWVPVESISEGDTLVCFGISAVSNMDSSSIASLNRMILNERAHNYLIEYVPQQTGYFWFCCSKPLKSIYAANGLPYEVETAEQVGTIDIQVQSETFHMHCYKTISKIVALEGLTYKFNIEF